MTTVQITLPDQPQEAQSAGLLTSAAIRTRTLPTNHRSPSTRMICSNSR
jgi:PIN domain nuclease of toxin-antitoxin system